MVTAKAITNIVTKVLIRATRRSRSRLENLEDIDESVDKWDTRALSVLT